MIKKSDPAKWGAADWNWAKQHIRSKPARALDDDYWCYTASWFRKNKRYIENCRNMTDIENCRTNVKIIDRICAESNGNAIGSNILLSAAVSAGITVAYIGGINDESSLAITFYNFVIDNNLAARNSFWFFCTQAVFLVPIIFLGLLIGRSAVGVLRSGPVWQRRADAYHKKLETLEQKRMELLKKLAGEEKTKFARNRGSSDLVFFLAGLATSAIARRQ